MFVLSLVSSALLNFKDETKADDFDKARVAFMAINALLAVLSIGGFEARQMMVERDTYFKSFWNYNDLSVLIFSILVFVLEVINLSNDQRDGD